MNHVTSVSSKAKNSIDMGTVGLTILSLVVKTTGNHKQPFIKSTIRVSLIAVLSVRPKFITSPL